MYKMCEIKLYKGDCLEVMDELIEQGVTVDAIITDPPYGTTACKWDSVIPFDEMWLRLNKLIKPNGAIVMTASQPFTTTLIASNMKMFKYCWYWEKTKVSGFMNAKARPLKNIEDIVVFSLARADGAGGSSNMNYYPQGLTNINKISKNSAKIRAGMRSKQRQTSYIQTETGYPTQIIQIESESKTVHPTQKPVALMEYLIKTYTNEGEIVLDFTMGSGTTGVACKNLSRRFIGIEQDEKYFDIAKNRINGVKNG